MRREGEGKNKRRYGGWGWGRGKGELYKEKTGNKYNKRVIIA